MVLLIAILSGLTAGYIRARISKHTYQAISLQHSWLVFLAYISQFLAFYLPATRTLIGNQWVSYILVGSQVMLIIFAWINRKLPGFWLLGLGLLLNFTVILLNGGWMPLPPENARRLLPPGSSITLNIGDRAGFGKDMVLPKEQTRLWFLGDIFMLPDFLNYPLAFSIGDILISAGAFWLLRSLGGSRKNHQEVSP